MLPKQIAVQKAGNKATAFLVAQHTDGKFIWLFVPGPFKTKHDHGYDGANITVKKTESDCPNFTTYERGNMTFHELLWGKQSNGNYYLSKQQYKGTVIPHDKFYYLGELIEAYKTLCNAVRLFQNGVSKESSVDKIWNKEFYADL